jgi:hypothetical protein
MSKPLSDAELSDVRERWEGIEAHYTDLEERARAMGELGQDGSITRPEGHHDIPRLLATIDALRNELR